MENIEITLHLYKMAIMALNGVKAVLVQDEVMNEVCNVIDSLSDEVSTIEEEAQKQGLI